VANHGISDPGNQQEVRGDGEDALDQVAKRANSQTGADLCLPIPNWPNELIHKQVLIYVYQSLTDPTS